jgi:hypothetical protein
MKKFVCALGKHVARLFDLARSTTIVTDRVIYNGKEVKDPKEKARIKKEARDHFKEMQCGFDEMWKGIKK